MNEKVFIEDILTEICIDSRIKDGIFNINNPHHLNILHEYLEKKVNYEFSESFINNIRKILIPEGNFPERQAYNENGVLVTFVDEESKQAAISRGTHFETSPTSTDDSSDTDDDEAEPDEAEPDEAEPDEPESIFIDYNAPEDFNKEKQSNTDLIPIEYTDTETNDDTPDNDKQHSIYNILKSINIVDAESDNSTVKKDEIEDLDLSIVFAISQQFKYSKSGNWYDKDKNFVGFTNMSNEFIPRNSDLIDKMNMWISDYNKREIK